MLCVDVPEEDRVTVWVAVVVLVPERVLVGVRPGVTVPDSV
jgi:hypothetical protein